MKAVGSEVDNQIRAKIVRVVYNQVRN